MSIMKWLGMAVVVMGLLAGNASDISANDEIILTTGDQPPFVIEGADDPGPAPAIVTAAFKETGINVNIAIYPWRRAENEVREGRALGVFPCRLTKERQQEFDFSDPFYTYAIKLFYNKNVHPNGIQFEKLEDLRPYRLGGVLGFWYESLFNSVGLQVDYVATVNKNIQKLQAGRIDVYPEEENSGWYEIRKQFPQNVEQFGTLPNVLEEPGAVYQFHLMVARTYPNSAELLKKFNAGLTAIRANGTYRKILEKYQISTEGQ